RRQNITSPVRGKPRKLTLVIVVTMEMLLNLGPTSSTVINVICHIRVVLHLACSVLNQRNARLNSAALVEHRVACSVYSTHPAATMQLKVQVRASDITRSALVTDMLAGLNLLPRTNPRTTNRVVTIIGEHAPAVANANTDTGTATKNARADPVHSAVSRSE